MGAKNESETKEMMRKSSEIESVVMQVTGEEEARSQFLVMRCGYEQEDTEKL